jgi:hypothetical protein
MEENITKALNKDISAAIKGFALILMVMLHCFGHPEWYVQGIEYSNIKFLNRALDRWIASPTAICVALFAFLTGWAYFYTKSPTIKYSFKKIINFLKYYWFQLFLIFLPLSILIGDYTITIKGVILNLFALGSNLVTFAWYVYFYIFIILTLPFLIKLFRGNILFDFSVPFFITIFYFILFHFIQLPGQAVIDNCICWFPCVLIGYLFAKYKVFNYMKKLLRFKNSAFYLGIILVIMICRLIKPSLFGVNLDVIFAPMVICSLIVILSNTKFKFIKKILKFLGKHSLNIWFLHSIFFSIYTREVFQRIAYLPGNPILVVVWVILLCIPFSIIINFLINKQEYFCKKIGQKIVVDKKGE